MMMNKLIIVFLIFVCLFINFINCNSLFKFLETPNYISSSQWRLSRDKSLNIGWEVEDHNNTIHSISSSNNNQYIVSCSNDKLAKFHRVLMYPNLYPDWTHIYYGDLKLRGYGNKDIENIKCLQTNDGNQLITLSINSKDNKIHLDTFTMVELDRMIENRKPILNNGKGEQSTSTVEINELSNITNFKIIFPLDDYNQVWVNSSALKSQSIKSHLSKDSIKKIEHGSDYFSPFTTSWSSTSLNNKPIMDLSLNGKQLLLSFDNKIKIQSSHLQSSNKQFKWDIIQIDNDHKIQDVVFIPDSTNEINSILVILLKDGGSSGGSGNEGNNNIQDDQKSNTKLILYKYIGGNGEKKWRPIELEFPHILLSSSVKMIRNKELGQNDCLEESIAQPIFVAFQDDRFTVHISQILNDKLFIIKSLPLPFHQELPDDIGHQVSIDFSKDSTICSIQYPNSNTIYIYSREDQVVSSDGLYDFRLTSIIDDLPSRSHGSVLLFNFKFNYLVTNFGGHLSFFRNFELPLSNCYPSSRTKSFYLPSPPLPSNVSTQQLQFEQYGLLYSFSSTTIIICTALVITLITFLQKYIQSFEFIYIGPTLNKILKSVGLTLSTVQNLIFYIIATVILCLSFYEIMYQSAFTNDWPAHIHHIDQFLNPPISNNNSIFKPMLIDQSTNNLNSKLSEEIISKIFPNIHDSSSSSSSSSSEEELINLNVKTHNNSNYLNNQFFGNWLPMSLREKFDFDYSHYMHYHGPNTYPAGFIYLYTLLYYISNHGNSLQIFQCIWAILEFVNFILLKKVCQKLTIPVFLSILPIISNRLHLYNVRVVVNDFPSVVLIHICILLLISKRFKMFSVIYSITVSLKLNTIFHSPAILFIFFNSCSIGEIFINLSIMASVQLIVGLPFLMVNPIAYFGNAYDFSRTLLWEKTRNFKFVGRIFYDSTFFNILLLSALIISICLFIYKFQSFLNNLRQGNGSQQDDQVSQVQENRIYILSFISVNFFAVVWARGLYTPFMCWYFYTFPMILYFSKFSYTFIILYWVLHEILFRFFKDFFIEMMATYIFFIINLSVLISLYNNFSKNSNSTQPHKIKNE